MSKWITFEWCLWEESIWKIQSLNISLWSPYISITQLWVKNLPTAVSQMTKALLYLFHHHYHSIVSKPYVMIIQTVIRFSWADSELMCGWLFCRLDGMIHPNMKVLSHLPTLMLFCKTRKMFLLIWSIWKSIEPYTFKLQKDINV